MWEFYWGINLVRVLGQYCNRPEATAHTLNLVTQAKSEHVKRTYVFREAAQRLTSIEVDRLVDRYDKIKNMREVAREFRISRTTVREHLRKRGIRVRSSMPMTEKQRIKAKEMYAAGQPSTLIGKKLGFSHHTILRAVRK